MFLKIDGIDSNNTLYGGNEEFTERGLSFIEELTNNFIKELTKLKEKGVLAAKTKVPTISLKAMVIFVDNFNLDQKLFQFLTKLGDLVGDSSTILDLKKSTFSHLKKLIAENQYGSNFLSTYFKGF